MHAFLPARLVWTLTSLAAVVVLLSGSSPKNQLLTPAEKASILGADANAEPTCYYLNSYVCAALNGTSGSSSSVTACGQKTFPTCGGDCTNSCSGTGTNSWACQSSNDGEYSSCPKADNIDPSVSTCGWKTTGSAGRLRHDG